MSAARRPGGFFGSPRRRTPGRILSDGIEETLKTWRRPRRGGPPRPEIGVGAALGWLFLLLLTQGWFVVDLVLGRS